METFLESNKLAKDFLLQESLATIEKVKGFKSNHFFLNLSSSGKGIGSLEYYIIDSVPHIEYIYIEAPYRRKGYATQLINYLSNEFPYSSIEWGVMIKDGKKLKKSLDRRYL